jgi:hypothetical protein
LLALHAALNMRADPDCTESYSIMCPCGAPMRAVIAQAGSRLSCPSCGKNLDVPSLSVMLRGVKNRRPESPGGCKIPVRIAICFLPVAVFLVLFLAVFLASRAVQDFQEEMRLAKIRETTQRIAELTAADDREALLADDATAADRGNVNWLLAHRETIISGFSVTALRNGDGAQIWSTEEITHLGRINIQNGHLTLGFKHDRATGQIVLVTCSSFFVKSSTPGDTPPGLEISVGRRSSSVDTEQP